MDQIRDNNSVRWFVTDAMYEVVDRFAGEAVADAAHGPVRDAVDDAVVNAVVREH